MKPGEGKSKGLGACEDALQRLLDGKPVVPEHVDLDLSKLTASIVSHEAGFDRGYLKKSRKAHLAILARIDAARAGVDKKTISSSSKKVNLLEDKLMLQGKELSMVRAQRDRVLAQNIQLWERVRELELELSQNRSRKIHHLP